MPKRGGSRGKAKSSLHHLSREFLEAEHFDAHYEELYNSDDRACALVGGAVLDQYLVKLLREYFIPLDEKGTADAFYEPKAPLGTFSSRIYLAYLLGAIPDDVRQDLDTVRRIRNVFAHRVLPLEFSHPLVSEACDSLRVTMEDSDLFPLTTQRLRFISAVLALVGRLTDAYAARIKGNVERLHTDIARKVQARRPDLSIEAIVEMLRPIEHDTDAIIAKLAELWKGAKSASENLS